MSKLHDKVAIVTGAASGIGRACAIRLAQDGAAVVIADIDAAGAGRVAEEIEAAGGQAIGQAVDLAIEDDVRGLVAVTETTFGGVDILHNNAAATGPGVLGSDVDVVNTDVEVWDTTMTVNVRGAMLCAKHAIPSMIGRGGGSVINMSSNAAAAGDVARVAYGVSKGAISTLTRYIATQYGTRGVRCNAISPGLVMTAAADALLDDAGRQLFQSNNLTPELCRPEDIADVVSFLASDGAALITGEIIRVDGGMLSHLPMYAQMMAMVFAQS
jgi:NAD(P)-dependent dehydrogenase (short-subunit alcohol dehydrogenase family)